MAAEYRNDQFLRDMIADVLVHLSPAIRHKLHTALQPWDDRFIAATQEDANRPLPTDLAAYGSGFWWYRVPKRLNLAHKLYAEGWPRHYPGNILPDRGATHKPVKE